MSESKTSAARIAAADRRQRALELRRAGATFEQIAEQLGFANRGSAYRTVMQGLKEVTREPSEELLELELQRLDAMAVGLWAKARSGNASAVDRYLRIMDRRSKYLGLDNFESRIAAAAEDANRISEAQGVLLSQVIVAILGDLQLSAAQQKLVPTVVPRHLRAIAGGA